MEEVHAKLLSCYTTLRDTPTTHMDRDVLIAICHVSSHILDLSLSLTNTTRTCPGMYWRNDEVVQAAIKTYNESGNRKRRKVDSESACKAVDGKRVFGKYVGPGPNMQSICNVCGQSLNRDVKHGFILKTK